MNSVDLLRDIHGLDAVPWLPLAIGWWWIIGGLSTVLIITLLLLLLPRFRQKKQQNWQCAARLEWAQLSQQQNQREQIINLASLLRRVAIQRYGRLACAGLTGKQWLEWLTQHDPKGFDWMQFGPPLIDSLYAPLLNLQQEQLDRLSIAVKEWI